VAKLLMDIKTDVETDVLAVHITPRFLIRPM
jgi:hypothetical protein